MGRHPVAVVISHVTYARTMEVNYLDLVGEGYMGSMQWQLGREMGTKYIRVCEYFTSSHKFSSNVNSLKMTTYLILF